MMVAGRCGKNETIQLLMIAGNLIAWASGGSTASALSAAATPPKLVRVTVRCTARRQRIGIRHSVSFSSQGPRTPTLLG